MPKRRAGRLLTDASAPRTLVQGQLSYLFQIVRNLAIDHYRKQALELKYSGTEEEGLNVVIHGASPETSHINFNTLENIADALTELPQRTRYAFEMYRLHGVPQKDIAKELGVSPTLVNFMIRVCAGALPQGVGQPSDTLRAGSTLSRKNVGTGSQLPHF